MPTGLSLFRPLCSKVLSRESKLDRVNIGIGLFEGEGLDAWMSTPISIRTDFVGERIARLTRRPFAISLVREPDSNLLWCEFGSAC